MKIELFNKLTDTVWNLSLKLYAIFVWAVQILAMGTIGYGLTMFLGVFITQRVVFEIMKALSFKTTPTAIDLALMVGIPTVFIMSTLFILMWIFYRKLWAKLNKICGKLRNYAAMTDEGNIKGQQQGKLNNEEKQVVNRSIEDMSLGKAKQI